MKMSYLQSLYIYIIIIFSSLVIRKPTINYYLRNPKIYFCGISNFNLPIPNVFKFFIDFIHTCMMYSQYFI